ncbi:MULTISPECIES: S8 family serine peptidase [unclassified Corynebacterium]|uniref:S8 family serine peptidase n=1 Tax=unclassified Corynebacterium TaxID=2624378 RepID=UPI0003B8AE82|nr:MULTISPECIES: S8 family serine peptidase [unclassified Corynebacterium]ERS49822.1 type VII secretion-associated serine protease mycosin [Corynebacterium sp. KPL1855]ERS59910.1 type VII secretion-associated serine protease mycosin [Corynebacterium sp. KPL1814]ERS78419.1 type VII secretion-associated serine protease mycosin [Corynebacterium sp. KPL1859]
MRHPHPRRSFALPRFSGSSGITTYVLTTCVLAGTGSFTTGAPTAPIASAREPDRECATAHPSPLAPEPSEDQRAYRSQLHSFATGEGVTVAVIDTGVAHHEQLPNLTAGADLVTPEEPDPHRDCDLHGTVVAGIIAGHDIGIAPRAEVRAIRQTSTHYRQYDDTAGTADEDSTTGSLDTLARAIDHAVEDNARVINISVVSCVPEKTAQRIDSSRLDEALDRAEDAGAVVIAASGNISSGTCEEGDHVFPADSPTVLSISAQEDAHALAEYSLTPADGPQLSAHGFIPLALNPAGGWADGKNQEDSLSQFHGTSFAAPVVSGTAALLAERYPDASAADIRQRLLSAGEPGNGFIDPLAALTHIDGEYAAPARDLTIQPSKDEHSPAASRTRWMLGGLVLLLTGLAVARGLRRPKAE